MPPTNEEELGRRRFQLYRDQAVEAAIEKIRHAPAAEWHSFSGEDYVILKEMLGEIWISLGREKWQRYAFSTLTRQDLHDLIALGHRVKGHSPAAPLLEEMDAILSHTPHGHHFV